MYYCIVEVNSDAIFLLLILALSNLFLFRYAGGKSEEFMGKMEILKDGKKNVTVVETALSLYRTKISEVINDHLGYVLNFSNCERELT